MNIIADTHAHSLMSGHAYSTIREMAAAAAAKGLQIMALTEHAPKMPGTCGKYYFENLDVVPREMSGIRMLFGAELNIMDAEGNVDLAEGTIRGLDIVIASVHPPCYGKSRTEQENTQAYIRTMENPYINIIGHPDDGRFPINYEELVKAAKRTHTLLELNNSSLRPQSYRKNTRENMLIMLDLCKQYGVHVSTGSDAHVDADAGNFTYVKEVLSYCDFPQELVATTDWEVLKSFLNVGKTE